MGLIQTVRLMLDQASLRQLKKDAAAASLLVAKTLTDELGNGKQAEEAVLKYALRLRRVFEKQTEHLRDQLAKGLITAEQAEASATAVGQKYTAKLAQELKKGVGKGLWTDLKKKIIEAAVPRPEELAFRAQNAISRMWSKLKVTMNSGPNMTQLLNIPDAVPLTGAVKRTIFSQAGGDRAKAAAAEKRLQQEIRATNTEMTRAGKIMTALGFNVYKLSTEYDKLGVKTRAVKFTTAELLLKGMPMQAMFQALSTTLKGVAGQMAALFGVMQLFRFAKDSVLSVAEAEASWSRLSITLADFGVKAREAWPEIKKLTDALSAKGYKPTFTAEVLGTLVQITGDYEQSLRAVPTVLDMVIERHMTWETAARNVGRAIIGDTINLQRHAIFLDHTRDALTQLIERFGGAASARSNTLSGTLDRMGVMWWQFKQDVGGAIVSSMEANDMWVTMAASVGILANTVKHATGLFKFLGIVFTGIALLLNGILIAIDTLYTLVEGTIKAFPILWQTVKFVFHEIGDLWTGLWRGMYQIVLDRAEQIAKVVKVITRGLIDATKMIKDLQAANNTELARTAGPQRRSNDIQNLRTSSSQWLQGLFQAPDEANPLTDLPTQNAGKIQAREQMKKMKEIADQRRLLLSEDAERSERAAEHLNRLYEEQNKLLEDQSLTVGTIDNINIRLSAIEAARKALIDRNAAAARKAARDTEVGTRIELLSRVALLDKDKERKEALEELASIEVDIRRELEKTVIASERYFTLQDRILKIAEARKDIADKDNKDLDIAIARLSERVELDVDRADAIRDLIDLQELLNNLMTEEGATQDQKLRRQKQLLAIGAAIRIEDETVSTQIERYREWLTLAEKREIAEARLVALRKTLQDKLDKVVMTEQRQLEIRKQLADVEDALKNRFNLRSTARAVSSLEDLSKNGMTREKALETAIALQDVLNDAMERGNLLLDEETQVLALLERLRKRILSLQEPSLKVWKELHRVLKTELGPAIKESSSQMAQYVVDAFTKMSSSMDNFGRNAKDAVRSIPQSILASMTDGIKQTAQKKVQENVAWAAEQTGIAFGMLAHGNLKGAGVAFKSAAAHALAAAKWGLIGGGAGAATAGLLKDGGSGGGKNASAEKQVGPEIHLYIDGVDPSNPRHQALVGSTIRQYEERYGVTIGVTNSTRRP